MIAGFDQTGTNLLIVIDLAVEQQCQIAVLAVQRLCACLGNIDDAQAAVSQCNVFVNISTLCVRSAVLDLIQHLSENHVRVVNMIGESYKTTHKFSPLLELSKDFSVAPAKNTCKMPLYRL